MSQAAAFSFEPGALFAGRYEIQQLIARGSFGWTVKALDTALDGEIVALKLLFPQLSGDRTVIERLSREVLLVRQLAHPTIARVFDLDRDETHGHFISMEYIDGWNLAEVLKKAHRELSTESKIKILFETATALEFAHKRGVIHRDFRPNNILLSKKGEVKLTDFSIARSLEDEAGLTRTGEMVGSPAYMAPEQFLGEEVDCQTDVYAFGLLAAELLSGKQASEEGDYLELAKERVEKEELSLPELGRDVPVWLSDLVNGCTYRDKETRFASGKQLAEIFRENAGTNLQKPLKLRLPSLQKGTRKNWILAQGYLFLALLLGTSFCYVVLQQTIARRYFGARLLKIEKSLGRDLSLLKRFIRLEASLLDADPIGEALRKKNYDNIWTLLLAGAIDLPVTEDSDNLLHTLNFKWDEKLYQPALNKKEYLNGRNGLGETPIIQAMRTGRAQVVEILLKYPVDLTLRDNAGLTAIHVAARNRKLDVIELIKGRGNIDILDVRGNAALHLAAQDGEAAVIEALLKAGANIEVRDALGRTALMIALQNHQELAHPNATYSKLLAAKPQLSARDHQGETALHYAVRWADIGAVRSLLAAGASPRLVNGEGLSAVALADSLGFKTLLNLPGLTPYEETEDE